MGKIEIRALRESDLSAVAEIHALAFPRQHHSHSWVKCNAGAYPRMRYFVACANEANRICGFVLWSEKSGFREQVVLELEQIAVLPDYRNQGIGERLIRESLPMVVDQLLERGARLKAVIVTTRMDNSAQRLYKKALGAEVEAVISELYSADEVIMVSRHPIPPDPTLNTDAQKSHAG